MATTKLAVATDGNVSGVVLGEWQLHGRDNIFVPQAALRQAVQENE